MSEADGAKSKADTKAADASEDEARRRLEEMEVEAEVGVHMPGVFPEQEMVEVSEAELSERDRRLLADMREAVGEGNEEPEEGSPEMASEHEGPPLPLGRKGAVLSWWYAFLFMGVPGVVMVGWGGVSLLRHPQPSFDWVVLALGLVGSWVGYGAWRNRPRKALRQT